MVLKWMQEGSCPTGTFPQIVAVVHGCGAGLGGNFGGLDSALELSTCDRQLLSFGAHGTSSTRHRFNELQSNSQQPGQADCCTVGPGAEYRMEYTYCVSRAKTRLHAIIAIGDVQSPRETLVRYASARRLGSRRPLTLQIKIPMHHESELQVGCRSILR